MNGFAVKVCSNCGTSKIKVCEKCGKPAFRNYGSEKELICMDCVRKSAMAEKIRKRLNRELERIIYFYFMKKIFLIFLFFNFAFLYAQPTHKIMSYNALNYPGSTAAERNPYFSTVVSNANPDILVMQEMTSQAGVNGFLNKCTHSNKCKLHSRYISRWSRYRQCHFF